jgi:hypothetical protein
MCDAFLAGQTPKISPVKRERKKAGGKIQNGGLASKLGKMRKNA